MYIDAEEKGLRETLETLIKEESWKPMEDAAQTNVLRSASELFAVIKKSLQRCSRFVSRGEPMLRLMGAFQVSSSSCLTAAGSAPSSAPECSACKELRSHRLLVASQQRAARACLSGTVHACGALINCLSLFSQGSAASCILTQTCTA